MKSNFYLIFKKLFLGILFAVFSCILPAHSAFDQQSSQFYKYLKTQTIQLSHLIGTSPAFIEFLNKTNISHRRFSAEEIQRLDTDWKNQEGISPYVFSILQQPVSLRLRNWADDRLPVVEILITDAHGLVAAATNKTAEYDHSQKKWWQRVMALPRGKAWRGAREFGLGTLEELVPVGFTVTDRKTGEKLGVVKIVFSRNAVLRAVV